MSIIINNDFKDLIQPLADTEFEQLEKNILSDGCLDSLKVWDNTLIDGHNRYEICIKHGIDFKVESLDFDDVIDVKLWILKNQLGRRNLSKEQMDYNIGLSNRLYSDKSKFKGNQYVIKGNPQNVDNQKTVNRIAKDYNISHMTVTRNDNFSKGIDAIGKTNPEFKKQILSGSIKIKKSDVETIGKTLYEKPEPEKTIKPKIETTTNNLSQYDNYKDSIDVLDPSGFYNNNNKENLEEEPIEVKSEINHKTIDDNSDNDELDYYELEQLHEAEFERECAEEKKAKEIVKSKPKENIYEFKTKEDIIRVANEIKKKIKLEKQEKKQKEIEKKAEIYNPALNFNTEILEGDIFEKLNEIEDNSVDLLNTDPPYMVLKDGWDTFKDKKEFLDFTERWLKLALKKIKSTGRAYISFAPDYQYDFFKILEKNNFFNMELGNKIIWVKRNNNQMFNQKRYRLTYEPIFYLFGKEAKTLNFTNDTFGQMQTDVWEIATPQSNFKEGKYHPAQKPLELYDRIIRTGSFENDLVLDCFGGSGTTAIICKKLKRRCILIEKDEKYIKIIKGRL